jgi:hypothetical protein
MLPEYDFSKGVHGKDFKTYQENTNVIFLEKELDLPSFRSAVYTAL